MPTQIILIAPAAFDARRLQAEDLQKQPAFAFTVRSKGQEWRRGELNPCPRRFRRKHLHVYPVSRF